MEISPSDPQSIIDSPRSIRVAIDARSLAERNTSNRTYWCELVAALGRRADVELLLVSNGTIDPADVPPNARSIVAHAPDRWFSLVVLPKVVLEERADVAHVQYTVSPLFRVPVVTTVHDVSFFVEPAWFGLKDRLILRRTVPAACRRAARVLAPSQTCREEILAYVDLPPEKVVVTLEGTPGRLLRFEDDPEQHRVVADLTGGAPYVLLVGGASPRKNLAGALAAVREARTTVPDLRLLVTGNLARSQNEGWLLTPGPLPEAALAAAYRGAFALLHPSLHEGFGLTLLEAMALGCPVVASDRGALPEVAGDAALLYDATDARGMAEGLVSLLNPAAREDLVNRGRTRAASFSWDAAAEATIHAYAAACRKGG